MYEDHDFRLGPPQAFELPMTTNYAATVKRILRLGASIPSRFGQTRELLDVTYTGMAEYYPIRKGMNRSLGYMELAQILAGYFNEAAIMAVSPNAAHSLFTKEMAYGPRIGDGQIPVLIEALKADPATRQAVLFYAKPEDGPTSSNPCTTTGHFIIRGGMLHYMVNMRSWDMIKGAPYDICCVAGLTQVVAKCLGIPAGFISIHADSAHVYEKDIIAGKVPTDQEMIFEVWAPGATTYEDWMDVGAKATMDAFTGWADKAPEFILERGRQEAL